MKVVIKLGGTLLEDPEQRERLIAEIASVQHSGRRLLVVHGGGKQLSRYLAEKGIQSEFRDGLRVSNAEVIDALLKVLAGKLNKEVVALFRRHGVTAIGLTGIDGALVDAVQLDPALGAVGKPSRTNGRLLNLLTDAGYLPVVACLAGDRYGNIYNVNADQMAASCARAFEADLLVFLTDVEGVLSPNGRVIRQLNADEIEQLIGEGIATGGMAAKLRAAAEAIESGLRQVVIAPGRMEEVISRVLSGELVGTRLLGQYSWAY